MNKPASLVMKMFLVALVVLVLLVAIGYLTARNAQRAIEQEVREVVLAKNVRGFQFDGKEVAPEQVDVTSWIEWPFVVVGSWSVPVGMHRAYSHTTYLVLPWRRYVISTSSFTSV